LSERHVDVVVVGAGPGGSTAALESARRGLSTLLLDAKRLPRAKTCGGGVSPRGRGLLRRLGLWERVRSASYPIEGIRLVAPSGRETVMVGAASAVVLPRSCLDEMLAREAVRAGAQLRDGLAARGLLSEAGQVVGVRTDEGDIRARWVIAADGASARFSTDPRPRRVLQTCMAWFEKVPFMPHVIEMIFDPELEPHYGWLFPEAADRVNIGICIQDERREGRSIREVFQRFLDKYYAARLAGARQLGDWRGHPVLVTGSIRHLADPGVLLVGEACRLVNATTGEGIAYAMESGLLAAGAIARGMRDDRDPVSVTRAYVRSLRFRLGLQLFVGDRVSRHGMGWLDHIVSLGRNPLFRRIAKQPAQLTLPGKA